MDNSHVVIHRVIIMVLCFTTLIYTGLAFNIINWIHHWIVFRYVFILDINIIFFKFQDRGKANFVIILIRYLIFTSRCVILDWTGLSIQR